MARAPGRSSVGGRRRFPTVPLRLLLSALVVLGPTLTPGPRRAGPASLHATLGAVTAFEGAAAPEAPIAFALSELTILVGTAEASVWRLAPPLLQLIGVMCAVGWMLHAVSRRLTRQHHLLIEAADAAARARRSLQGELAAREELAHEARNALESIEAATRAVRRHGPPFDRVARDRLDETVSSEVRRLQRLLDVAAGACRPERCDVAVGEVLMASVRLARVQGLAVTLEVPGDLHALGDATAIRQVLHNLLQNAGSHGGGIVSITGGVEGDEVVIRVADEGPGIAHHERRAVFDRGMRGSSSHGSSGRGLGLYVSSQLMLEQHGTLSLEGAPSGGACFVIGLPRAPVVSLTDGTLRQPKGPVDESGQIVIDLRRPTRLLPARPRRTTPWDRS